MEGQQRSLQSLNSASSAARLAVWANMCFCSTFVVVILTAAYVYDQYNGIAVDSEVPARGGQPCLHIDYYYSQGLVWRLFSLPFMHHGSVLHLTLISASFMQKARPLEQSVGSRWLLVLVALSALANQILFPLAVTLTERFFEDQYDPAARSICFVGFTAIAQTLKWPAFSMARGGAHASLISIDSPLIIWFEPFLLRAIIPTNVAPPLSYWVGSCIGFLGCAIHWLVTASMMPQPMSEQLEGLASRQWHSYYDVIANLIPSWRRDTSPPTQAQAAASVDDQAGRSWRARRRNHTPQYETEGYDDEPMTTTVIDHAIGDPMEAVVLPPKPPPRAAVPWVLPIHADSAASKKRERPPPIEPPNDGGGGGEDSARMISCMLSNDNLSAEARHHFSRLLVEKHPELKQDAKTDTYGVEAAYYHMRQQAGKADAKGGDGDAAYDSFGMHAAERSIMDAGGGGGLRSDLKTIMASMNPSMSDQQRAMSFGAVRDSGHGGIFANYQSPIAPGMYSTGGDHTGTAAGNRFGCSRFGGPDQSSFMM